MKFRLYYVHVIPAKSLSGQVAIPVTTMRPQDLVQPSDGHYQDRRIDHLGYMLQGGGRLGSCITHTGRNGIIEYAIELASFPINDVDSRWWVRAYDKMLIDFIDSSFQFLTDQQINGPAFICVSICNAGGLIGYENIFEMGNFVEFDGNILDCDIVHIEGLETQATAVMKQPLDTIWNGFGAERCPSYDDEGNWRERNR